MTIMTKQYLALFSVSRKGVGSDTLVIYHSFALNFISKAKLLNFTFELNNRHPSSLHYVWEGGEEVSWTPWSASLYSFRVSFFGNIVEGETAPIRLDLVWSQVPWDPVLDDPSSILYNEYSSIIVEGVICLINANS